MPRADLERLIALLRSYGWQVVAPTYRDGAIVHAPIESADDLPHGVSDVQAPGWYRAQRTDGDGGGDRDDRIFDFASAPTSLKRFTYPSVVPLGSARREGERVAYREPERDVVPTAFLGARACDIAALRVQDRVLVGGPFVDEDYQQRRAENLVIGVECATPSGTCFCSSMGTGPEITTGFDIALTELDDGFVARSGTRTGADLLDRLGLVDATPLQLDAATRVSAQARARMGAALPMAELSTRLIAQHDNPHWAEIAERCLTCTNCTLVCPTCFCTSVGQTSDLLGAETSSERRWDSCFNPGFAEVAGGNFRPKVKDRYRQWLTHKFGTWVEQFGTSGCVGCGRCITWCPVGIDVREELMAIAPPDAAAEERMAQQPLAVAAAPGRYAIATVRSVRHETADTKTLILGDLPAAILQAQPGQFVMVDLPSFSAAPISISRIGTSTIELTIRGAGPATKALIALQAGAELGLRGPLGRGWPVELAHGRDVIIVAGGIGLAPLRVLLDAVLAQRQRFGRVQLFVGARTPGDLPLMSDLRAWQARTDVEVSVTVDRADPSWTGPVGVVTQLFDRMPLDPARTVAFICGPEKMMQATSRALAAAGVPAERTLLTLERRMECGIGLCGHCQLGSKFVCRDGPVFSRAELGETFEVEGI